MARETEAVYERAGITENRVGYGDDPALLVIDLQRGFTNPACVLGGDLSAELDVANDLVDAAHAGDIPVVFTRCVATHPDGADFGIWLEKFPTLDRLIEGSEWVELDPDLHREDRDHVLDKRQASALHETELSSMLTAWGVDTLVLAGTTTSGCVRATAVDGCAHGYRTIVAEGAVGDRAPEPHDANLFDIDAKYGDVRPADEVASYLETGSPEARSPARS